MSKIIGIDLGTSNTVVSVCDGHKTMIVPNAEGYRYTPSVVGIDATTGEIRVGASAKRQAPLNPEGTVFSGKRLMGMPFEKIRHEITRLPYEVVRGNDGEPLVLIGTRTYSAIDISAAILEKAKQDAACFLKEDVSQAVITVPAYFNDRQRKATRAAGQMAGLDVVRIINEPTAAALAYYISRPNEECTVAVVHVGGGSLDIAILQVGEGVFEIKSVNGDTHLGGDDFDQCIIDWASDELCRVYGTHEQMDAVLAEILIWEAEKAKCDLSTREVAELVFPYVKTTSSAGYKTVSLALARSVFEARATPLIDRISGPCKSAMKDADVSAVNNVILVGQQTRMPAVQKAVEDAFAQKPRRDIDPAEVVARGAAVQAAVLAGEVKNILLMDVIPLSLGIETLGGVFTTLLERNTTIPTKRSQVFSTTTDNQREVTIHIYQGEREMAANNVFLGEFTLHGIPLAPSGIPQIEVTFDIDANGILLVYAKDLGTGRETAISIDRARTR